MLINHLLPVFFPVSNPLVNRRLTVLVLTPRAVAASTMLICIPTSLLGGLPGWVPIGCAELRELEFGRGGPGFCMSLDNSAH